MFFAGYNSNSRISLSHSNNTFKHPLTYLNSSEACFLFMFPTDLQMQINYPPAGGDAGAEI